MRGSDAVTGSLFSYVDLEERIPQNHPLRVIREVVNEVLATLSPEFDAMYSAFGRPSIPPEKLLRGSLIQAFFTVRSERQLMEQLDYNLMFRWFVGMGIDDPVWDHSTYSKNRDRLLEADIAKKFLKAIVEHGSVAPLLSDDHFSVDGTLVNAWASLKSFVPKEAPPPDAGAAPPGGDGAGGARTDEERQEAEPPSQTPSPAAAADTEPTTPTKDAAPMQNASTQDASDTGSDTGSRNADVDFRGQKRTNTTHVSTTDPEARLYRKGKGKEARLCFMGHSMIENRHGLVVETAFTQATGFAERQAAKAMITEHSPGSTRRITVGADKGYDTADFVADLRAMEVTPHVAQKVKGSALDARTTRHEGYAVSQKKRKLVEEPFGWGKTYGGLARPMRKGTARQGFVFTFVMAAYDLVRLPRIFAEAAAA